MILHWLIYGAVVAGVTLFVTKQVFREKKMSKSLVWVFTIVTFLINLVILSTLKHFRYESIAESTGVVINPSNPLDVPGATAASYLFYSILASHNKKMVEHEIESSIDEHLN